jgi:Spy/CpxP family protein refolding chaperone
VLKKNLTAVLILAGALGLPVLAQQAPPPATAPNTVSDQDIQLLRQDLRSQKKQLMAANLQLTDAEATKFWPVYDAYTAEATKIGDTRLALIKEYAQTYDTMTDAQAKSLIKRWAATDQTSVNLRMQYMPKFEAVLPGKKAALFFQLDRRVALLIDLQLASSIPMVKQ